MKKILIACAVAMSAVCLNAATFSWVINNVKESSGSGNNATGYSAYLFLTAASGNVQSFVPTASLTTLETIVADLAAGTFSADGAYFNGPIGNATAGAAVVATGISTSFAAGDSLSGFVVIFDSSDYTPASNYMIAQNSSGDEVLTATWTGSSGAKSLAFGSQASNTWNALPVPEPTSGLLMLVGLAGLALRRRRA